MLALSQSAGSESARRLSKRLAMNQLYTLLLYNNVSVLTLRTVGWLWPLKISIDTFSQCSRLSIACAVAEAVAVNKSPRFAQPLPFRSLVVTISFSPFLFGPRATQKGQRLRSLHSACPKAICSKLQLRIGVNCDISTVCRVFAFVMSTIHRCSPTNTAILCGSHDVTSTKRGGE